MVVVHDTQYIQNTFIGTKEPNRNYGGWSYLKTGYGGYYGNTMTLIRFDQLPSYPALGPGDEIINASLNLYQHWDIFEDGGHDTTVTVHLHRITETWQASSVTWNNQPNYDGTRVYDYERCREMAWRTFDITLLVKGWYRGEPNHGVLLKQDQPGQPIFDFLSTRYPHQDQWMHNKPMLVITYRNQLGLEGYLSYTTMGLGRSGSAAINNYNGNLVYTHADISLAGNRLPLHISHVYNSGTKGINVGYGNGWRLNLHQRCQEVTIGTGEHAQDYVAYTDGDGTVHHFWYNDGEYHLQTPGIYLKLVKDGANYVITDGQDNQLTFNSGGYLIEIKDNQGNTQSITYSSNRISAVTDGAGRTATFSYSSGLLAKITDPAGREVQFQYTGNNLTRITYPDNQHTYFAYKADSSLSQVTHPSGQKLEMDFFDLGSGSYGKAYYIAKHGAEGELGQSYQLQYWDNATVVTDSNGQTLQYIFNHAGNVQNVVNTLGHASYYEFEHNRVTRFMATRSTTINLLRNHNFERSEHWTVSHEGGSTANTGYVSTPYHGNQSVRIQKTNASGQTFYQQIAEVTPGETYTLSAYLKTNDISETGGARLLVRYTDGSGATVEEESLKIFGTHDWQRIYFTFTVPAEAQSSQLTVGLAIDEEGTVWFDNVQLETGSFPTSYNLVENPHFEWDSNSDGRPDNWSFSNLSSSDMLVVGDSMFGNRSFKIIGNEITNKNVRQLLSVSGQEGDIFIIGAWARAEAVPRDPDDPVRRNRRFALCLGFFDDAGGASYVWRYFNTDYTDWQHLTSSVIAPRDYTRVTVYAAYYNTPNSVYFDGIQVNKESDTSFTYDEFGNITSVNDPNNNQTTFTYDANNDLIQTVDPQGGSYNYIYDARHNLLSAISPAGTIYSFTHDEYGNLTTASHGHLSNQNLLRNGSFHGGVWDWERATENNTGIIQAIEQPEAHSGSALAVSSSPVGGPGHVSV